MFPFAFNLNPSLSQSSRLRRLISKSESVQLLDYCTLIGAGITAALASGLLDFSLRIPGHAILRVIFPMTLGLALVPRRGAGTLMSLSAVFTGAFLRGSGIVAGMSIGAFTSLLVTGPLLDLVFRNSKKSRWTYLNCALAGLLSNSLALGVRGASKWFGWERLGKAPFEVWFSRAAISYPICGLIAGLVCAAILFSMRSDHSISEKSAA